MSTCVVTGSAGGIGGAVRDRLEAAGDTVVGVDLHDAEVTADLADPRARREAVRAALERVDGHCDRLVVCAGVGGHVPATSTVVRVNCFAALAFLDGMQEALAGGHDPAAVVVASNSAALIGDDDPLLATFLTGDEDAAAEAAGEADGAYVYAASKRALTVGVRQRVAAWGEVGVRLNAVAPGPVETDLLRGTLDHPLYGPAARAYPVPLGRWAQPAEIATTIAFLLDPASAWTHGAVLFVDGGTDASVRPRTF